MKKSRPLPWGEPWECLTPEERREWMLSAPVRAYLCGEAVWEALRRLSSGLRGFGVAMVAVQRGGLT